MAKEWILNSTMNRFQLNFKRNVGPTSESIRLCSPKSIEEWEQFYFSNIKSKEHITQLGKQLYTKISEVITNEVAQISEQDCINYMINMVIDRTYSGYLNEINTVYGQLEIELGEKIEPAPDKWDRLYNVDFFIKINEKFIGIQIKPINNSIQIPEIHKEYKLQEKTHKKFSKLYGGKVFYIYSYTQGKKKIISNPEVIKEILSEINRLKSIV